MPQAGWEPESKRDAPRFSSDAQSGSADLVAYFDDTARIEISDTGIEISEEDQQRLFERFFRASEATEQAIQGTGLGLSITAAIAEGHGGTIEVTSEVGRGTTFTVVLPVVVVPRAAAA